MQIASAPQSHQCQRPSDTDVVVRRSVQMYSVIVLQSKLTSKSIIIAMLIVMRHILHRLPNFLLPLLVDHITHVPKEELTVGVVSGSACVCSKFTLNWIYAHLEWIVILALLIPMPTSSTSGIFRFNLINCLSKPITHTHCRYWRELICFLFLF